MISDTFNSLAREFIKELSEVFPENSVLTKCVEDFDSLDPEKPAQFLMKVIGDKADKIHSKDETIFEEVKIDGLEIDSMWKSVSDDTKEVVWQYLTTLTMFASTLDGTSGELMSGIEQMATEFAEKLTKGNMDLSTMLGEVMQRVQAMDLSSLEGADIGALTKSLGIDQDQITDMMNNMMGGGTNKELMNLVSDMMGGGEADEQDLLKLLESAKPPPLPQKTPKKKSGKKNRKNK
jgi:hypothetical protein